MSFLCLCTTREITGDQVKGFKVSTYFVNDLDAKIFDELKSGVLPPEFPMKLSIGHAQFLADKPHIGENVQPGDVVRHHYPNVDIFRCELCGAGFIRG